MCCRCTKLWTSLHCCIVTKCSCRWCLPTASLLVVICKCVWLIILLKALSVANSEPPGHQVMGWNMLAHKDSQEPINHQAQNNLKASVSHFHILQWLSGAFPCMQFASVIKHAVTWGIVLMILGEIQVLQFVRRSQEGLLSCNTSNQLIVMKLDNRKNQLNYSILYSNSKTMVIFVLFFSSPILCWNSVLISPVPG